MRRHGKPRWDDAVVMIKVTEYNRELAAKVIASTKRILADMKSKPMPSPTYSRFATVVNVVDGDTVDVTLDLGFHVTVRERMRLDRINAPDAPDVAGKDRATAALKQMILGKIVVVQATKTEKYGRWLAEIWTTAGTNVNDNMVAGGFAVPYDGGKR